MSVGEVRTTEQKTPAEMLARSLLSLLDDARSRSDELLGELDAQAARVRELEEGLTDLLRAMDKLEWADSYLLDDRLEARDVLAGGKQT